MLDINSTLIVQIVNFLVLLFLLNIILFKPIRGILRQRSDQINSLEKAIEDYQERSEQHEKSIEEDERQARKDGHIQKESFKNKGIEEEKEILLQAGSSAEEKKEQAGKEMEDRILDIRKRLEGQIGGFSQELAEKILGRSVQ